MRALVLGGMIAGAMAGSAAAQDRPQLFISPMGEPFRGASPENQWFDGADTNHDGVLSFEEMTADAARFFALLDVRKDGEIDPQDMERYESEIVPDIWGSAAPREPEGYRVGDSPIGPRDGEGGPTQVSKRPKAAVKQGAARFGYFDFPQPIMMADRNFNRGVDAREFAKAAEARFDLLDKNGDGRVEKRELPELPEGR